VNVYLTSLSLVKSEEVLRPTDARDAGSGVNGADIP